MSNEILTAIDEASAWMDVEGVESVGEGESNGRACILVGVSRPAEEMKKKLPETFHGFPVRIEYTGTYRAQ